jgi:homoserine O-acetyltransferase
MSWPTQSGVFSLGDLALQSGEHIPAAKLSWKAHGTLSPARDNVIVYPTSYSAQHPGLEWAIGPDSLLDPGRWFIVIPDMFGNGLSSSPSNTPDYPGLVTSADNVLAQQRLLREVFGVEQIAAVYGFSMGAQQAYHWAALAPDVVARAIVVCGSARTAPHNQVFLASLMAVLEAAPEHLGGGRFSSEPLAARRAFTRNYAGWAMSQDWYRAGLHLSSTGATTLDEFLDDHWGRGFQLPASDLYAQLRTWYAGDISANDLYRGDLAAALGAIRAQVLLLPGETDLYFPVADNAAELVHLQSAELRPIPSIWGHVAGAPANIPEDFAFLKAAVRAWLDRESDSTSNDRTLRPTQ